VTASALLGWSVLVPLLGACASAVAGTRAGITGIAAAVATGGMVLWLVVEVWEQGTLGQEVGGWGAPLGIELEADGLSAVMLLTTAGVGLLVSLHALPSFPRREVGWSRRARFWPLWLLLWAALNALFLSQDVFNIYVTLELVTLAAVGLIVLGGEHVALTAGLRYLLAAVAGSLFYLLGVALLYGAFATLDVELLGERVTATPAVWVAIAAVTLGLAVKAALFPLHFWLPSAHASAPAPVSAVLSALVIAAAFYVVLLLWRGVFAPVASGEAVQLLGVLGALAVVVGSASALRQRRLKLLIAHSSVAQVGYLFIAFPLGLAAGAASAGAADAYQGAVYQILAHAFAKAAMFLAAGNIVLALGHDRLRELAGVAARLPLTMFTFALAGVSLAGLPPSGGFAAKWLLLNAAIDRGEWWWAAVLAAGSLAAAAYVLPILRGAFRPDPDDAPLRAVPAAMQIAPLVLALAAIALGLQAAWPLQLLDVGGAP
jgi:multicomponent Na+:H+ antiporter subunit D